MSARDVGFWINLLKANTAGWASYVPGGFPDNVVSWKALSPTTVQLRLNASYNPFWFTYNELRRWSLALICRSNASSLAARPARLRLPRSGPKALA